MTWNDDNYLQKLREDAADARSLTPNARKAERERLVVVALLRCLGVSFAPSEIIAAGEEPIDVEFPGARFQIREIVGDRKRGKEWAEREQLYREAKTISDVMMPFVESTPIPFDKASEMVAEALAEKISAVWSACLWYARRSCLSRYRQFASLHGRAARRGRWLGRTHQSRVALGINNHAALWHCAHSQRRRARFSVQQDRAGVQ